MGAFRSRRPGQPSASKDVRMIGDTLQSGARVDGQDAAPQRGAARDGRSALFVISNLGLGGAERQLVYLAAGLKRRGWDVAIANMTPLIDPVFAEMLAADAVPVHVLQTATDAGDVMSRKVSRLGSMKALATSIASLRRLTRTMKPGAIVGFMPHGGLLARLIGRMGGVPLVVTSLRNMRSTRPWHDRLLAATKRLDSVLVTNSAVASEVQVKDGVATRERSVVIHNGFDLARVAPSRPAGDESASPQREFTWLNIAVFRTEKGHPILLEAARELARTRSFKLRFAGNGPVFAETRAMAERMGLQNHVEFLGWQAEVSDLIASADAFVLASLWEGLPNVLLEALAGGLPAVATAVGGVPELVEDEVSGLLVPPGDPAKLAAAMARIMDMAPADRANMGAAGRTHVIENFSMETMVDRWEQLLSGQIAGEGSQPAGEGR